MAIKVGHDDILAASAMTASRTVAAADGLGGGPRTFRTAQAVRGRYVVIWFTKLPPTGPGKFQAQVFVVVVRGWR